MQGGRGYAVALLTWLAISGAVYLAVSSHEQPRIATVADSNPSLGEVVIPRSRDGHYYVEGAVNGHPAVFMVDTGASLTSIGSETARSAGLPKGAVASFQTAGGTVVGEVVAGIAVEVAGVRIDGLRIAVMPDAGLGRVGLLGQNFLRRLEVIQRDDQMVLRLKTGS